MIVISAGMQKAGTGWFFNMLNDLIIQAGYSDVREIRDTFKLDWMLRYQNCNIGRLLMIKFMFLFKPLIEGKTFVVKTHSKPTFSLRILTELNLAKSIYVYRDPRDAAISAFEHGIKLRNENLSHSFARLNTLPDAIRAAYDWSRVWEQWAKFPGTLLIKYEDLSENTWLEMKKCVDFLNLSVNEDEIQSVIEKYTKDNLDKNKSVNLHFNRGISGRYKAELNDEQIENANDKLSEFLPRMGYVID